MDLEDFCFSEGVDLLHFMGAWTLLHAKMSSAHITVCRRS
jgi:hypothetical protein